MREYFNPHLGRWIVYLDAGRTQYRYRYLMEKHLNRHLETWEHVHHINGDQTDDRIENLQVLSASDHQKLHAPERARRQVQERSKTWGPRGEAECSECGTSDRPYSAKGMCGRCYFRLKHREYGGHQPRKAATVLTFVCENCGETFTRTLGRAGEHHHRRFCGVSCASQFEANRKWALRRAGNETIIGKRKVAA